VSRQPEPAQLLAKQYDVARIDEARDATLIQVLDRGVPPERKSKPKRSLIVLLSTLANGFIAILRALVREATKKAEADPQQADPQQAERLMPGDTVVVPKELERWRFTRELKGWTRILYQFALGVAGLKEHIGLSAED
jgi:hypothetical protein